MTSFLQFLSEPHSIRFGWALIHILWQGLVIAALLELALLVVRPKNASLRYILCGLALALFPICLAITFSLIGEGTPQPNALIIPHNSNLQPLPPKPTLSSSPISPLFPQPLQPSVRNSVASLSLDLNSYIPTIVALWLLGVVLLAARKAGGFIVIWRLRHRSLIAPTQSLLDQFRRICQRLGIDPNRVALKISSLITVPVTMGWLKPIVLLPATLLSGLTPDEIELLLAHELAHIRRHDYLVNLLQTVIETLFFYHPLTWWISRRMKQERENACDDLIATEPSEVLAYAQVLLRLEQLRPAGTGLVSAANGGNLLHRIQRLTGEPTSQRVIGLPTLALLIGLFLVLIAAPLVKAKQDGVPTTILSAPATANNKTSAPPVAVTQAEMKAVEDSQTPLMKALHYRKYDEARALLAQGADCNATDKMGSGALAFLFSSSGNDGRFPIDILQTLLARTSDPNPPVPLEFCSPPMSDPLLQVAFFAVAYSKEPDHVADLQQAVKLLIGHGARFTGAKDDVQTLLQAAALDDLPTVQKLVAKGTSASVADGDGWTPLLVSIALNYQDMTDWLIEHGANVSAISRRGAEDPLTFAIARGDDALVEKLLAKGAKPVLHGGSLWRVVDRNDQRMFDDLINAGADPKQEGSAHGSAGGKSWRQINNDSLFLCIAKGQTAMALTLIAKGVNPEPSNVFNNQNFAYYAVQHDRPEILQALLDHGANPFLKSDSGETPLSLAQKSHPDLVPMLQAAAAKAAPKSETSTGLPEGASLADAQALTSTMSVTCQGTIQTGIDDYDLSKTRGSLVSVLNDQRYDFSIRNDGSFTVPDVKSGIYERWLHLVWKTTSGLAAGEKTRDLSFGPSQIVPSHDGKEVINFDLLTPSLDLPKGTVVMGMTLVQIPEVIYQSHREDLNSAIDRGDVVTISQLPGVGAFDVRRGHQAILPGNTFHCTILANIPRTNEFGRGTIVQAFSDSEGTQAIPVNKSPIPNDTDYIPVMVDAHVTPSIKGGKVTFDGPLRVFANGNQQGPAFPAGSVPILETTIQNTVYADSRKGFWLPGAVYYATPGDTDPRHVIKKRMLVFLSAVVVRQSVTTAATTTPNASASAAVNDEGAAPKSETSTQPAMPTTNSSISSAEVSPPKGEILIEVKVAQFDEDTYVANKNKIDAAINANELSPQDFAKVLDTINSLPGVNLRSFPSLTTKPGFKANFDVVREMPYPTEFEPPKVVKNITYTPPNGGTTATGLIGLVAATPREFVTKDVGVSAEIMPSLVTEEASPHGSIILDGKFTLTTFEGFTKSNLVGTGTPSFSTSESHFIEALKSNGSCGIWIPGSHMTESDAKGKLPSGRIIAPNSPMKQRMLLFLTASLTK